jgi:ABC-type multidrug transport system ATPase subunit
VCLRLEAEPRLLQRGVHGGPTGGAHTVLGETSIEKLLQRLRETNVGISDLATEEPDLEDVFVAMTSS